MLIDYAYGWASVSYTHLDVYKRQGRSNGTFGTLGNQVMVFMNFFDREIS